MRAFHFVAALVLPSAALAQTPVIASVLNAASSDARLCPGVVASVFGSNLGPAPVTVQVGGFAGFVIFASATQLNIQIPVEAPVSATTITVTRGGVPSAPFNITLDSFA